MEGRPSACRHRDGVTFVHETVSAEAIRLSTATSLSGPTGVCFVPPPVPLRR
jgi:hypothetical protein